MNKQIFPNRWFVWIIAIIVIVGFGVWVVYYLNGENQAVKDNGKIDDVVNQECDYNNPDKKYVGKSNADCSVIRFRCKLGTKNFSDECGCGCEIDNDVTNVTDEDVSIVTADKTIDWQTYRNEEYGFEVKYPEDWIIEGFQEIIQESSLYPSSFSFYFQDSKLQEKQKNFYDKQNMFVGFHMLDPSPLNNIEDKICSSSLNCIASTKTIGGVKAVVTTFEHSQGVGGGNKNRTIEFIRDGKFYSFYTGSDGIPQESIFILSTKTFYIDQILSTFKFIDN